MRTNAYFELSSSKIIEQYDEMKKHCDIVSYSAKTNYDVVPVLQEQRDAYFSVHDYDARNIVAKKQNIIYFLQADTEQEVKTLHDEGIYNFVVDNEEDLKTIRAVLQTRSGLNVLIRMRLKENTVKTGKHFVFGMKSDAVNNAVTELSSNENVNQIGVHVHRKSQNVSEWRLKEELKESLTTKSIESIHLLSTGGGFPVRYKNYQVNNLPMITQRLAELRDWLHGNDITMICEPGRFIAAPPGTLKVNIKQVYGDNIVVDASVYNAAMDTFVTNTRLEIQEERTDGSGKPYTVKGVTPDSLDIFRYKAYFENPEVGDTLTFLNATAYNYASDFCNLPSIPTKVIK